MRELIKSRIDDLKKKHSSIKNELDYLQNRQTQLIAELNGAVGAIAELEDLLKAASEPVVN